MNLLRKVWEHFWRHSWLFICIGWIFKSVYGPAHYESGMAAACMFLLWLDDLGIDRKA